MGKGAGWKRCRVYFRKQKINPAPFPKNKPGTFSALKINPAPFPRHLFRTFFENPAPFPEKKARLCGPSLHCNNLFLVGYRNPAPYRTSNRMASGAAKAWALAVAAVSDGSVTKERETQQGPPAELVITHSMKFTGATGTV